MTPAEFKAMLPEFASTADDQIQTALDSADPYFDVDRWGAFYSEGVAYFAAHKLSMAAIRANQVGKLMDSTTMKKEGDMQVNRSEAALLNRQKDPFQSTIYGQEYRRLARLVGAGALVV